MGLKYYGIPGIDVPPNHGFQYREPDEEHSFMKEDEYDELIADPTAFLYNVWLHRVSTDISPRGAAAGYRNNLALVKGGMAMLSYFNAFGEQNRRLREESGSVSAISGILKAPLDILGDKLRGYVGLTMDLITQPKKVLRACEALMPHLYKIALDSSDPDKQVPIGYWMHRGCVPFVTPAQFESHYWPTIKPILEELWRNGHQTLCYAEGNWDYHLTRFAELPEKSIIFHVDRGDIFKTHQILGSKFCLSGGIPNTLLSYGTPDEVRERCKKVLDGVAREGGYIMDASAIIQNDASVENLRVLTDFTREYGIYSETGIQENSNAEMKKKEWSNEKILNGSPSCISWEEKLKEIPSISGDPDLFRKVWEEIDAFGHTFIWQCLLSF
jgi:hypothetical protein